ncbi:Uncharacterized protein FWK35_00002355 [Aphis craccivora]|uniref:Uncharacterized protein n=1 Tax=Aphis craccivora TaxID=307492 RepID=A0A6G0ZE71_APHCR|nr:Uncharacterized protein FWK35_00002355 [Aphis craccivora]
MDIIVYFIVNLRLIINKIQHVSVVSRYTKCMYHDVSCIMILLDSKRGNECIDFTMLCVFFFFLCLCSVYTRTCRNNASISNFGGGFR